ncbi:MAG TPA: bifunctional pyr operon transcriptional regulator/uracil phosphoribosyltransferase PyrR [candidate division Zixibacteria bacterium]|nr:bifunctional pyr operon transcriptional regulator/uracil phosphoribosyltransferase PyrR [candidate division Zixibacteria bacterium]
MIEILDKDHLARSITRIATEVVERNAGAKNLAIVGIRTRGVPLAERLANEIETLEGIRPPVGTIDITLYRDDFKEITSSPDVGGSNLLFGVEGKDIVLVDDVLFTGRTVRSAIEAIIDYGRPNTIQLVVIVDRGHRELPICADYLGKKVSLKDNEYVEVHISEIDGEDRVVKVTRK